MIHWISKEAIIWAEQFMYFISINSWIQGYDLAIKYI